MRQQAGALFPSYLSYLKTITPSLGDYTEALVEYGIDSGKPLGRIAHEEEALRIVCEMGIVTRRDYENHPAKTVSDPTILNEMAAEGILRRIEVLGKPYVWNGPHNVQVLYYVEGMEGRAAQRLASWLASWESMSNREKISVSQFLYKFPEDLREEVRERINGGRKYFLRKQRERMHRYLEKKRRLAST